MPRPFFLPELPSDWSALLHEELQSDYFAQLDRFVAQEYESHTCYPPRSDIFNAFNLCRVESVRVVLLGQDPYHEAGQANGLCFSVEEGMKLPPSLRNIFKEIANEGASTYELPSSDLRRWATQGVLLLNTTLTVREHAANSHTKHGWERFTDAVIRKINDECTHVVFLLWGANATQKLPFINTERHLALCSAHPSPLSAYRGFFGNNHFNLTNNYLINCNLNPIHW